MCAKYISYIIFVKVNIYFPLFMTISTFLAVSGSKMFAVKDVESRGALVSKFHVICKCRDTVGTEHTCTSAETVFSHKL